MWAHIYMGTIYRCDRCVYINGNICTPISDSSRRTLNAYSFRKIDCVFRNSRNDRTEIEVRILNNHNQSVETMEIDTLSDDTDIYQIIVYM